MEIKLRQLVWLIGPVVIYVLVLNYKFLVADQTVYFISPFKQLYENFALNDWFTWEVSHWHLNFSYFVIFYSKILGVEIGTFLVFVCVIVLFCWISFKFISLLGGDILAYSVFLVLLLLGKNTGLGLSRILPIDGNLVPMDISMVFMLFSFYYMLSSKYTLAGLFAGLAGCFHVTGLILMGLIIGIYFLLNYKAFFKNRGYYFAIGYLLFASPTFYFIIRDFGIDTEATSEAFALSFHFLWFHVSPHLWGPSGFVFAFLCQLMIWKYAREKNSIAHHRVFIFSLIIAALLVIAYIFSLPENYNLFVVRLFLWRASAIVIFFAYLLASIGIVNTIKQGLNINYAFAFLLLFTIIISKYDFPLSGFLSFILCLFIFLQYFNESKYVSNYFFLALLVIALFGVAGIYYVYAIDIIDIVIALIIAAVVMISIYICKHWPLRWKTASYAVPSVMLLICAFLVALLDPALKLAAPKLYSEFNPAYEDLIAWVRHETRSGELFLINPELRGFRARTHRGVFVTIKNVPARGDEIKEWAARLFEVYDAQDIKQVSTMRYTDLNIERLQKLCQAQNLQYLVLEGDPKLLRTRIAQEPVFHNENFYVVRCSASASSA